MPGRKSGLLDEVMMNTAGATALPEMSIEVGKSTQHLATNPQGMSRSGSVAMNIP